MKKLLVRLVGQSSAMVVAMLALFVALTGTAVATTSALITGNQIKNSSITGLDVKNKSLTPKDFRGSVRGLRGLRGLTGAAGPAGPTGPPGAPNPNAANSELLDGKDSSEFVPNAGTILVANDNWDLFASDDAVTVTKYSDSNGINRAAAGAAFYSARPDIPPVLYGRSVRFKGIELCYNATDAGVSLIQVSFHRVAYTSSGIGSGATEGNDNTTRDDAACRVYLDPTPSVLTAENTVNAFVRASWTAAGGTLYLGRTTFIFEPTATAAADPAGLRATTGSATKTAVSARD